VKGSSLTKLPSDIMKTKLYPLVAVVLSAGIGLSFGQPVITQQPQSCTNIAGTTATFTVTATGTMALAYQWQWGVSGYFYDRTDGTNTTLVLTNVGSNDAMDYRVIITNVDGAITSDVATLTVLLPPTNVKVTVTPTNSSVSLGASLTLRVTASGTLPLGYQWCLNCAPLSGRTSATLSLAKVELADAGPYTVVVTNAAGGATSGVVTLQVDPTFTKITTGALATDVGHWHGAAWGDYDNDGYPDLFVHQHSPTVRDYLYRNNGDGTFTRLTAPIPQGLILQNAAWGNAWGDYDNDGHPDLFISNNGGKNVLLHSRGDGTFEKIASGPGAEGTDSSAAAWGEYDRDGYLDLFVVNGYMGSSRARHWLYHNQGDGSFRRMGTNDVGYLASESVTAIFASWVDYDEDGWQDLILPFQGGGYFNQNLGNGSFACRTNGVQVGNGYCFASADYDNDGRVDVCAGGYGTPTVIFHNEGGGTFRKVSAAEVGIPTSDQSWGGGVAWGDYDNDGFEDLFVAGGWWNSSDVGVTTRSFLYHNNGDGTFTPVRTGSLVNDISDSMGAHWVDYDRDGFLDLFVNVHGDTSGYAPNLLYRNNGNSNNWLCVTCVGTASPRDGTGAKVRTHATIRGKPMWQLRLIDSGGTCWGGQSFVAHFGLGDATNVDVLRIEWSSGTVQELYNVPGKQYLRVTEPAKLAMPQPGQLNIQCWKWMAYRIEGSPDLSAWTPLAMVTNLTGKLQWTDTNAPGQSVRFYRVVKQ
jgi:hypothetical protein